MMRAPRWSTALALTLALVACKREARRFAGVRSVGASATDSFEARAPGVDFATTPGARPPAHTPNVAEESAWDVAEGQRLYTWYNCVGCHAHGGGGMGPPLLDAPWRYGASPADVYTSIVEGRPNGMPSFRGRIPARDVWRIVAYVRSLSGQLRFDIQPGRGDELAPTSPPTSLAAREHPRPEKAP